MKQLHISYLMKMKGGVCHPLSQIRKAVLKVLTFINDKENIF